MWLNLFTDCPSCNQSRSFGYILLDSSISDEPSLLPICKLCNFSKDVFSPQLNKRVIYLDHFFVSNVLKISQPKFLKTGMSIEQKNFYELAWQKLWKLYLDQLIVCPFSWFHKMEAMEFSDPSALQEVFEKLSGNVFFHDPFSIYKQEIIKGFMSDDLNNKLVIDDILYGIRNSWTKPFRISLQLGPRNLENQKFIMNMQTAINNFLIKAATKPKKKFQNYFEEIIEDFITQALNDYLLINELNKYSKTEFSINQRKDMPKKFIREYFPKMQTLRCMAVILADLVNSSHKSVDRGMFFDISMVSSLLPFCDAIFIDRKIYNVLCSGNPSRYLKEYQNKIFSLHNHDAFLEYLSNIEKEASSIHMETVRAIYSK